MEPRAGPTGSVRGRSRPVGFTLPKMLRPYFLYHREFLGEFARRAYVTVQEMMVAAVEEPDGRPARSPSSRPLGLP